MKMKPLIKLTTAVVSTSVLVTAAAFVTTSQQRDQSSHKAKSHTTLISDQLANDTLSQFQQQLTVLEHQTLSQLQLQLTPQEEQKVAELNSLDHENKMPPNKAALFEKDNALQVLEVDLYRQFWALHPSAHSAYIAAQQQKEQQVQAQSNQEFYAQPSGIISGPPNSPAMEGLRQSVDIGDEMFTITSSLSCLWNGRTEYFLIFGAYNPIASNTSNGYPADSTPQARVYYAKNEGPNVPLATSQYSPTEISYPPAGSNPLSVVGVVGSNAKVVWGQGNVVYFNFVTRQFSFTPSVSPAGSCSNWSNNLPLNKY